jgi:hypothetical protein
MSMVDQHLGRRGSRYDPTKNCPKTNSIVQKLHINIPFGFIHGD